MKFAPASIRIAALLLVGLVMIVPRVGSEAAPRGQYFFYVGTYTDPEGKGKGIYVYRYDANTHQVTPLGLAAETTNPSWIVLHPNGRFLYAANEVGNYKGANSGGVSAFSIDRTTGKLNFLNEVRSKGADPCYITIDKTGKWALVANYTGGSVAVFPVLEDGKLGEASDFVQHTGHGANPKRQEGPHAHSIDLSPDNRFAFVNDLGMNGLLVYKFDSGTGKLTGLNTVVTNFAAGAGPRHFALHPSGKFAYVIAEMQSTVTTFAANLQDGTFQPLQFTSTVPRDFTGENSAAEVEVAPSGKFLFASNRGHDSIIAFAIDPAKGTLTPVGYTSTLGKTPRSFEIDPTGTLLFAANQKSDNIAVFAMDANTGHLTPTGQMLPVGSPVCVKFVALE